MELTHPLDATLRERLKTTKPNQAEFGKKIGRSAGWVNKYMHGAGNATIDDVVRIIALLIGLEAKPVSEPERKLLKVWRQIPEERHEDALVVMQNVARGYRPATIGRRAPRPKSGAPAAHTQQGKASKAPGRRSVAEGP